VFLVIVCVFLTLGALVATLARHRASGRQSIGVGIFLIFMLCVDGSIVYVLRTDPEALNRHTPCTEQETRWGFRKWCP